MSIPDYYYPLPSVSPFDDIVPYRELLIAAVRNHLFSPDVWADADYDQAVEYMADLEAWLVELPLEEQAVEYMAFVERAVGSLGATTSSDATERSINAIDTVPLSWGALDNGRVALDPGNYLLEAATVAYRSNMMYTIMQIYVGGLLAATHTGIGIHNNSNTLNSEASIVKAQFQSDQAISVALLTYTQNGNPNGLGFSTVPSLPINYAMLGVTRLGD